MIENIVIGILSIVSTALFFKALASKGQEEYLYNRMVDEMRYGTLETVKIATDNYTNNLK
jgi:hypothetical protein